MSVEHTDLEEADMDYLTVKEYAERFRLHEDTVYAAIRMKKLRFAVVRAGKRAIRIVVPRPTVNHQQQR